MRCAKLWRLSILPEPPSALARSVFLPVAKLCSDNHNSTDAVSVQPRTCTWTGSDTPHCIRPQGAAEGGSIAVSQVRLSLPQVSLQQGGSVANYYPDA
jgi:hypothetical protein